MDRSNRITRINRRFFSYPKRHYITNPINSISFTCTTTGAQTLEFDGLDVADGETITVYWGDGTNSVYSGAGARSHNYASANTWKIRIVGYENLTKFNCDDTKLGCAAGTIGKMVNLEYLLLAGLAKVTVGSGEIGLLTSLTHFHLYLDPGITIEAGEIASLTNLTYLNTRDVVNFTIEAGEIASLTNLTDLRMWTQDDITIEAGDIASLTNLTYLRIVDSDNIALQTEFPASIQTIQYENNLIEADVDALLAGIYADWASFTYATPSLDIAGDSNAAPSGVYQDGDPPTTGLEYVYELANDPETTGNETWTITYEGGSAP